MLAAIVSAVVGRVILDDFGISHQAYAGVGSFDQVMAKKCVLRETAVQNAVDDRNFVNPFSREDSLPVEVLINIGDGPRVNIESGLYGIDVREAGARSALYAHPYTRLKNAVARDHDVLLRINDGLVQRMRQRADKALGGAAWQLRVSVQSDDESYFWKDREITCLDWETVIVAGQNLVQVHQLTALTFPSHPDFLARVINAMTVEHEKRTHLLARIFFVQFLD